MTAWDELTRVRVDLKSGERTLDDLWHDRPLLWQGLAWSRAQLRLWLRSLPGIAVRDLDTDNPAYCLPVAARSAAPSGDLQDRDLGALVAEILAILGRPAPLALVRARLLPGLAATGPMIRAAVQSHPWLALTRPLVRLLP